CKPDAGAALTDAVASTARARADALDLPEPAPHRRPLHGLRWRVGSRQQPAGLPCRQGRRGARPARRATRDAASDAVAGVRAAGDQTAGEEVNAITWRRA